MEASRPRSGLTLVVVPAFINEPKSVRIEFRLRRPPDLARGGDIRRVLPSGEIVYTSDEGQRERSLYSRATTRVCPTFAIWTLRSRSDTIPPEGGLQTLYHHADAGAFEKDGRSCQLVGVQEEVTLHGDCKLRAQIGKDFGRDDPRRSHHRGD